MCVSVCMCMCVWLYAVFCMVCHVRFNTINKRLLCDTDACASVLQSPSSSLSPLVRVWVSG